MNQEQRMRKRWLPKEKKKKDTDEGIINWIKVIPLIFGLIIAIIALIVISLKWSIEN